MAGSYANFLAVTTQANKNITDYSGMTAHEASKIAGYEAWLSYNLNKINEAYPTTATASTEQQWQLAVAKLDGNYNKDDAAYVKTAIANILSGNTLLEPAALTALKNKGANKGWGDATAHGMQRAVEDNVYLTWKAAGSGDYSRKFGERVAGRNGHDIAHPYTLNPNYVPQNSATTLKGDMVQHDKDGNLVKDTTGNLVVNGGGTTGNTQNNPYRNADGTANIRAITETLKELGYAPDVPTYNTHKAVNPLEGKTAEELNSTLAKLEQSDIWNLLTEEAAQAAIFGQPYAQWAQQNGLDIFTSDARKEAYLAAAEAGNKALDDQYQNAVNAFYQALGAQSNTIAQELRKAAAQAQASRATAGITAANQLAAALGQTQKTSNDALKLAQQGIDVGNAQAEKLAAALQSAYKDSADYQQKNVELKNNTQANAAQGLAAVGGLAGAVADAKSSLVGTLADSDLRTQEMNAANINNINSLKGSNYEAQVGNSAYVTQSLLDNVTAAAANKSNLLAQMAANGLRLDATGNFINQDGKVVIPKGQLPY